MTGRWQNLSDTTKVGIGAMVIISLVIIIGVITGLWFSDDASDKPESVNIEAAESPEPVPDDPPIETNTSPEFDTFVPTITRIGVVPNDVAVYVFCDGSTRVYVMNTVSTTKQLEIVPDFPGCRGERIAGEQIPG